MRKVAEVEVNKWGTVIIFPKTPNRDIYKMLLRAGFTKTGAMGWHHWISESQSEEQVMKARDIEQEYNAAKPEKKYRLYPKKQKAK